MRLRIKSTNLTLKIISWIQLIGGITGIGLMAYLMLNTGELSGAILLIFLSGLALFIFSIYAGKRLLCERTKKAGIILSVINQILQIIQFDISGNGLSYSSGIEFLVGIKNNMLSFDFGIIKSSFNMSINTDSTDFEFIINFAAIILIIVLLDIWKEFREENKITMANKELR
ncbi:hypothetical protein FPF71_17005 [Algibacter amylolyticus]|uniref:Uncharacterized protein n=1 Tax=Algibacter amylolyticus TaxID=1608400 RepID=A0A5M7AV61_9FLAO|nr:hypothetical protein [Algibacter amylolyticus]KAA5821202.1 hypothetical protein F2B50_17005 [Algibacter amylolyticus]MBB5269849.1 hypothetical protein [Algibacter amylolyticus]TSJ72148.1 hypothetical protein FPF71_17005 [Algibacter amylolyticus]